MSSDTILLVLGGIFVLVGIVGCGLEVKELKLPQVAGPFRLFSLGVGLLLIIAALIRTGPMLRRQPPNNPPKASQPAQPDQERGESDRPERPLGKANIVGACKLRWKMRTNFEAILVMKGSYGLMTTRFFNDKTQKTEYVDQRMQVTEQQGRFFLVGSNPQYTNTNTACPDYPPDIFNLQEQSDGSFKVLQICNTELDCAPVETIACKAP